MKIFVVNTHGCTDANAYSMLISRGWSIADTLADAEAVFVLRDWRENPVAAAQVEEARKSGIKMYWSPNPPPALGCGDFAEMSGVTWQDVTRPTDKAKGRKTFVYGGEAFDVWPIIEVARACGHRIEADVSHYSDTTVVATIFANGKRTFVVKLWCSNRAQAANVLEDIATIKIQIGGGR